MTYLHPRQITAVNPQSASLTFCKYIRLLFAIMEGVAERWCTVTVTDQQGRRHSLDVRATSTYDAAHLYVAHAKQNPAAHLPAPTVATVFEVVTAGRMY